MPLLVLVLLLAGLWLVDFIADERTRFIGNVEYGACGHQTSEPPPAAAPISLPSLRSSPPEALEQPAAAGELASTPLEPVPVAPLAPPLILGRAVNGEPAIVETSDPQLAELAKRYQPHLRVAALDRFWPVSVSTLEALRREGRRTELVSGKERRVADLEQLGPQGSDSEFLDYPAEIDGTGDQFCDVATALGLDPDAVAAWRTAPLALNPYPSAQVYFLRSTSATYPDVSRPVLALQYWFFYPFNYLPTVVNTETILDAPVDAVSGNTDHHEGDFEHVSVLLDPESLEPLYLFSARHGFDEGEVLDWEDEILRDGDHPIVYASFGGHATYERCDRHSRRFLPDDWVLCRDDQLFTFWAEQTPLVDLRSVPWSCWPGHFGQEARGPPQHRVDGPKTPLLQQENKTAGLC